MTSSQWIFGFRGLQRTHLLCPQISGICHISWLCSEEPLDPSWCVCRHQKSCPWVRTQLWMNLNLGGECNYRDKRALYQAGGATSVDNLVASRSNKIMSWSHLIQWMHYPLLEWFWVIFWEIMLAMYQSVWSLFFYCSVGVVSVGCIGYLERSRNESWTQFTGAGSLWVRFMCLFLYTKN